MQLIVTKDKSGIRSILGLGNYYKRFIKSYCVITAPLQELLKKAVYFKWGDEQENSFVQLKDALCKAPVLAYPDPDLPYVVDTDASNLAISAVLSQVQDGEEKVIMYGSKPFSGSQRRWCMTRREHFAIIHFVTGKFSYYLLNQEFALRTDHSSLRWLDLFHDKATDVLAHWLHYLKLFHPYMMTLNRPGKLHGNAEALSRIDTRPCPSEDCPDHDHLVKKVKSTSEKAPRLLHAIQTRGPDGDRDLDTDLGPSLSDEEIRVSQKLDPELCRFMELLHEHSVKPNSKLLKQEPPDVKILCTLWYEFRV